MLPDVQLISGRGHSIRGFIGIDIVEFEDFWQRSNCELIKKGDYKDGFVFSSNILNFVDTIGLCPDVESVSETDSYLFWFDSAVDHISKLPKDYKELREFLAGDRILGRNLDYFCKKNLPKSREFFQWWGEVGRDTVGPPSEII